MYAAIAGLAASAISKAASKDQASAGPQTAKTGDVSDRSAVTVAPVGVNLGAILQPYTQGSPENGGYGMDLMSRYAPNVQDTGFTTLVSDRSGSASWVMPAAVIGGGILLIILIAGRKK